MGQEPISKPRLTILSLEDLAFKVGGNEIFSEITLEVSSKEGLTVLGESGRGKSSLIKILAGLETPSRGRVSYDDKTISTLDEADRMVFRRENIGLSMQNPHIVPSLNVEQNIMLALQIKGFGGKRARERVAEMMQRFEIDHRAKAYIGTLSGGEERRVSLARAFVTEPRIVLLDEPLAGLDVAMAKRITKEISALKRSLGALLVISTHDPIIADLGKVVLNMDKLGTPKAIQTPPAKSKTTARKTTKKEKAK